MQTARIILRYKDRLNEFDPIDEQLTFDVRYDPNTFEIDPTRPIFGMYGSPQRDECYPFFLKKDGRMDYGAYAAAPERYGQTDLLQKKLVNGEYVNVVDTNGDEWTYYVHSIDPL